MGVPAQLRPAVGRPAVRRLGSAGQGRSAGTPPGTSCPVSRSPTRIPVTRRPGLQGRVPGHRAGAGGGARAEGYSPGYLSAFPEYFFDLLEAGQYQRVWSPYYMIHKYLACVIDAYQLAGVERALDVAVRLADWVDRRDGAAELPAHAGDTERAGVRRAAGGAGEPVPHHRERGATWRPRSGFTTRGSSIPWPRARTGLAGWQCNVSVPKVIASLRLWEETGEPRYRDIAENFWRIATGHHAYVIGGHGRPRGPGGHRTWWRARCPTTPARAA